MTFRNLAAVSLAVISIAASLSVFVAYEHGSRALRASQQAQALARAQRKLTDLKLCAALNQVRRINNRDRQTFVRAMRETRDALSGRRLSPELRALFKVALRNDRRELADRPKLARVPCVRVIAHPTGELPPALTDTTPTTTG